MNAAAPQPFVQLSEADAEALAIRDGEVVEVATRRGTVRAPARVGGIETGHVFLPFHYGDGDSEDPYARAANELTLSAWDPVSKQPVYKYAAAQLRKITVISSVGDQIATAAAKAVGGIQNLVETVTAAKRAHVGDYLLILTRAHARLIKGCEQMARIHLEETEVQRGMTQLTAFSNEAQGLLQTFCEQYGPPPGDEMRDDDDFSLGREGALGLLRDLHRLFLMASDIHVSTSIVMHASKMLRDEQLLSTCMYLDEQNKRQLAWCNTQLLVRSPQTLVVPS